MATTSVDGLTVSYEVVGSTADAAGPAGGRPTGRSWVVTPGGR
jgi:hypothetical protein